MPDSKSWFEDPDDLLRELRVDAAPRTSPPHVAGYADLEEIRRGGQGVVFRATHLSTGRRVALKVLFDDPLSPRTRRRRFEREIELVCALEHPGVVRVYDGGVTDAGRLYLAMELIEGEELSGSSTRTLSRDDRIVLLSEICRAVHHAHQRGVIHRDLKPSNILVDREGCPHVLDFGIARPPSPPSEEMSGASQLATRTGQFVGTLAYASPEQITGHSATLDVRSDIYSLGVILHEVLTERAPYETEGSVLDIVRAIAETEPSRPGLDRDLDAILLKALAKDPERRYQSAGALADDLDNYLDGRPIDARRDNTAYVLRKLLYRHRWIVGLVSLGMILLAAFSISLWILLRRATIESRKLEQSLVFLEDTFGSVEADTPGRPVSVRSLLDEAVHWIEIALEDEPEVEASIRLTIGSSYRGLGLLGAAERQLVRARELHERHLPSAKHPDHARSLNALGLLARDRGALDDAERFFQKALEVRESAFGRNSARVSASYQNLASIAKLRQEFDRAHEWLRRAYELRLSHQGPRHPDTAMTTYQLAELAAARGSVEIALERHTAALDIRREALHRTHPDVVRSLESVAEVARGLGRLDVARAHLSEAIDLLKDTRGPDHVWTRRLEQTLASLAD